MTVYQSGQRVALVHTSDPHTRLRPGDTGTVRRHDQQTQTVEVNWDTGSQLSMCLDAGDRIQPLADAGQPANAAPSGDEPSSGASRWAATLAQLRAAGADAGRAAADWWGQDTVGGRAGGDVRVTARRVLAGIDDGDPALLDTLPRFGSSGQSTDIIGWELFAAATGDPAGWFGLRLQQRDEARTAYHDAFDTAAQDRVAQLCHLATSPTGRDVSHLHPDRVCLGSVGVFSGDWAWTIGADGSDRIAVGFVGTLIDTWNGWAVFSCTRHVAEAIVADQQQHRRELRESLQAQGVPEQELDRRVDTEMTDLRFDGDTIVADQRAMYDDPEAIERISPDAEGRYVVMGWNWCWEAVDPYACDRIVGDLPDPGCEQQWVLLPHTDLRVPHDRLQVTALQQVPTHNWPAYTATLTLDGVDVGLIRNDGNGGDTELASPASLWGAQRMADYARACRRHGEPVSEQQVLDALVTEHEVTQAIRDAEIAGGTLARLVDADGHIRQLRPIVPAPRGWDALLGLGRSLTPDSSSGEHWQIWTGRAWFTLPRPTTAEPN